MPQQIWFQQGLLSKEEVRISPDDRGYYFGDGIYEVFRVYHGRLFEADAHFDRLERTAAALRIPLPLPREAMTAKLRELIAANELQTGTVYMQITRGEAPRSHPFPADAAPVLFASASEYGRPLASMQQGISAVTAEDIRWLRCDLKTLNLLPNVLAKQEALDRGADEVILHRSGTVTECSASNVMIVRDGAVCTHPANHLILHGITRLVVLRLARELGIPVIEEPFTIDMLREADEAFITGTTVEVTPIVRIDDAPVAQGIPGPVTRRLQAAFELLIGL
ncbi:D-amino-acid transaminase [Paenibacillus validus]|uniref:D-alanine aminotransferase n=1 Tax=Paenibacillus validus TaxID=44253 RepID=A0A7X3CVM5_9BACL|nr:D-amino-acid transaminase [Paenibacillus validus]MED4602010.1 D-amino-acid transaminase [Paenibacillus validus]MED4605372.1 D-amino-acid transaminase [Paenibacillus validus]MUG73332.1 D-amino-acid transaminase [Paenibacillus validus]